MYNFSCTIFYLFISFFLDVDDWPITQRRIFQTTHAKCISGWFTHFLKISAILLGFISTAKFRKCHQLRLFLQLVSKFCSAIARQVPRGFTWCNRPWNVSIRFCCSERCYKWYLIFCCWTEVVKTNVLDESTLTRGGKLYNPSDESYFRVSDKQLHLHI